MDDKPEKLSKPEKQEKKKLETISERMEKKLEEKPYTKLCIFTVSLIDFLIFIGIIMLTSNIFSIILVYGYIMVITLISVIPVMLEEYERVGRRAPWIVRIFNSFLEKVLPFNRKTMKTGPSILIIFIYLFTLGGFIAIVIIIFANVLTGNNAIYDYLIQGSPPEDYGFFSFINNSMSNSLLPSLLWFLILGIPVIFCLLFIIASLHYRNTQPSKLLNIVIFSPLVVLLPLFLSATSVTSPSIVITCIFIVAWAVTLLICYREFTKRNALIIIAILVTQVLASFLIIYGFIFHEVANISTDISSYYNPSFLLIWFGVLVLIPIIIKGFDQILNGKIKILGAFFAVSVAVLFQIYFFPLFSTSIYDAYPLTLQAAEIYIGFGFFYFYIALLLIPLFFIFGYFQIGLVRWIYRAIRDYGYKIKRITLFKSIGGILASIFIFGLVFVYYFILYAPKDYKNMLTHALSLFNGDIIARLTSTVAVLDPIPWQEVFQASSLAITVGLLAYSSYRGAYNLALFADQIENPHQNIKRFGLFNFIIFTSPRSYKTRLIFGLSLIFIFLGITTIIAFLKIHSVLFADQFITLENPSVIIFETFDALKLGVSLIGLFIAILIFFYFIFR
ncbi:MAG: hypothetical protein ACFFD2_27950, partial [Promethearchaeota archaeon]